MFRARYAMAPYLSRFGLSVDQLDDPRPQVRDAAVGCVALDPVPRHLCEVAGDRAAAAASGEVGHVETDPADHVVDGVGAATGQRVVDREEQARVPALLEGVLDL